MSLIRITYDSDGDLSIITDPIGRTTTFGYDAAGRVTSQTVPDGRVIRTSYDANGNVTAVTPPERVDHSFSYTPVGLTSSYTPPDLGAGTEETQYEYNLDRQLTRITRPDGLTLNVGYDNAGRLGTLTLPEGQITYSYNTITGNLSTIADPGGSTLSYTYDGILLKGSTWSGEISGNVGHTFDNNLRITSQSVNGSNTINLQYDNDSLLTAAGSLTLSRNAKNGLITGTALGGVSDIWSYNGFGESTGYSAAYNSTGVYSIQYTRDNLGRITDKTETVEGVTDTYSYTYDTTGRLTDVKKNSVTNSIVSRFVYASRANVPDYLIRGGVTYRIISDHLGSPRLVIDTATGTIAQRMDYNEFGRVLTDTNPGLQPFSFAGGIYDNDTGLIRFGARDYDAETGRWTAKDLILFAGGDTNLYGYIVNDPVNLVDPSGLIPWITKQKLLAILAAIEMAVNEGKSKLGGVIKRNEEITQEMKKEVKRRNQSRRTSGGDGPNPPDPDLSWEDFLDLIPLRLPLCLSPEML